jgi:tRNA threonylcarbamoyladenosine biosynthesis protein TsaB
MRILAIETATEACSVALLIDQEVIEVYEVAPRRHAELVLPMIEALLAQAGMSRTQLDAIAVGRGPGAFSGVRLAIAVAQGLALAIDRPVLSISTLRVLAQQAVSQLPVSSEGPVLALIDARMGEVYGALCSIDPSSRTALQGAEFIVPPAQLPPSNAQPLAVVGSGLGAYAELVRAQLACMPLVQLPQALPRASDLISLAQCDWQQGLAVDAAQVQPVYLRDRVAQTMVEQEKNKAGKE